MLTFPSSFPSQPFLLLYFLATADSASDGSSFLRHRKTLIRFRPIISAVGAAAAAPASIQLASLFAWTGNGLSQSAQRSRYDSLRFFFFVLRSILKTCTVYAYLLLLHTGTYGVRGTWARSTLLSWSKECKEKWGKSKQRNESTWIRKLTIIDAKRTGNSKSARSEMK